MPGYRKTKNVDAEKMDYSPEELAYQKSYAKGRLRESDANRRVTGIPTLNRKGRAVMERVAGEGPGAPPEPKQTATGGLMDGLRKLAEFVKKTKGGYEDIQGMGK